MDKHEVVVLRREFRSLYKSIDDLDRRQASGLLNGKVAEIDGDRIRLELLPADGRAGGKPFLSPWVQVQEMAGATGSHFPVRQGDKMRLMSPNGEIGPRSLAIRDGYTRDEPNPASAKQKEMMLTYGGCEVRLTNGELRLVAGTIKLEGKVEIEGSELTHNGTDVGENHKHEDVERGGDISGPPVG